MRSARAFAQDSAKFEVSWALEEHPDKTDRRAAEERLIQLHREVIGVDPPVQHGGRGAAAYLEKRRTKRPG
jgi:hypothetical protein